MEIKANKENVIDDLVMPFSFEKSNIRGRVVRLGKTLRDIVTAHNYPAPVSYLLSEAITGCVLLSSILKYEGVFSLQIKGDSAIKALLVDITSSGEIRACASFDENAVKKLAKRDEQIGHNYRSMLGKGFMIFTVEQGENTEKYQGIVELSKDNILDCILHYFQQSEQVETHVNMKVHPQDDQWRSGAIMIQKMPENKEGRIDDKEEIDEDAWNRSCILLGSCKEEEILSPVLHSSEILYRLFHEEGVRVYDTQDLIHKCRCSKERVELVLKSLPKQECIESLDENREMIVNCDFCSSSYGFNEKDIEVLFA